jgi:hypothetical protein
MTFHIFNMKIISRETPQISFTNFGPIFLKIWIFEAFKHFLQIHLEKQKQIWKYITTGGGQCHPPVEMHTLYKKAQES